MAAVMLAALVLIVPAVGRVQALVQDPTALVDEASGLPEWALKLPYAGERTFSIHRDQFVELASSNAPGAEQVPGGASGLLGGVFGAFGTLLNLLLRGSLRGPHNLRRLVLRVLRARDPDPRAPGQGPGPGRGAALKEIRTSVSAGEVREDRLGTGDER